MADKTRSNGNGVNKPTAAIGPGDYYFNEAGFMVFTAQYHLKRGYCCKSGCKHCPYGFKKTNV